MLSGNETTAQPGGKAASNRLGATISAAAQAKFFDFISADKAKEDIEFLLQGYLQSPLSVGQPDGGNNANMVWLYHRLIDLVQSKA